MNPITTARLQQAFITFDTKFQAVFEQTPNYWDKIATLIPSDTDLEVHAWLAKLPQLREWIGPRVVNNLAARTQELKNKKYEGTFAVPRTAIEDDKIGVYGPAVAELARQAKLWPDKILVDAIIAGGATTTYDGQYFFDTDHPVDMDDSASASQANLFTTKPLTSDNYAAVRAAMRTYKAEDGVPLEVSPNLLVVPPALEQTARQILQAEYIIDTFKNSSNYAAAAMKSNVMKGTAELLVLPRLSADSDTSWYLLDTTRAIKPFVHQLRMAPEFAYLINPTDDGVFENDEYKFGVRARGAAGYGLWFLAAKCTA